jgi:16S rRNA U516 pseudouridylate synthase RsuA-like enzyme
MRLIRNMARSKGVPVTESEGGSHTKLTVGSTKLIIGRHRELKPWETRAILQTLENEFGRGWWKSA